MNAVIHRSIRIWSDRAVLRSATSSRFGPAGPQTAAQQQQQRGIPRQHAQDAGRGHRGACGYLIDVDTINAEPADFRAGEQLPVDQFSGIVAEVEGLVAGAGPSVDGAPDYLGAPIPKPRPELCLRNGARFLA